MARMITIPLFIMGTLLLMIISRKSLLHPRSHGFYRSCAWVILLTLFLLNLNNWFKEPLSWNQVVSWILLLASLVLVIQGMRLLREIGWQDDGRKDQTQLGLEKTPPPGNGQPIPTYPPPSVHFATVPGPGHVLQISLPCG